MVEAMPINLAGFEGSNQAIDARLLPESVGVAVTDAEPGTGDLRPLKGRVSVATLPTTPQRKSIWRMGRDVASDADYWLSHLARVNYAPSFGADPTEITLYTGDGTPKWTDNTLALSAPPYPQAWRELAVPAPEAGPIASLGTNGSGTEGEVFYVQTFVTDRGWESAPSPPSSPLLVKQGATVNLSSLEVAPAGSYGITTRRIYRTQPGTDNTAEFFFLREIPIGTASTTDDARALGALLATEGWIAPPADGHSVIALWNRMHAMLSGKTLYLCEPGSPYAWPEVHRKGLAHTGVALAKWGQRLVALTTGNPIIFEGQEPLGMGDTPLGLAYSCRSAASVVSFVNGVAWAASDGLAWVGDGGQSILTQGVLTADQWQALDPETMVAGRWGRFYVCSYGTGANRKGFIVEPGKPGIWWLSSGFDACHYDELTDSLYVLEGGDVRKFAAGATLTASFKAKRFAQTHPMNYGYAKVIADGYPVTLAIHVDGALKQTRTIESADSVTLEAGFMAEDWQPEVTSAYRVQAVRLAVDRAELKGL